MVYSFEQPFNGIKKWNKPFFDTHVHVWDGKFFPHFMNWVTGYYPQFKCLSMCQPEVKKEIEKQGFSDSVIFAYFMGVKAFGNFDIAKILEEIETAQKHEYPVLKLWFAPRFIDIPEIKLGSENLLYKIASDKLEPVFSLAEDYGFKIIIHVSDPDLWYYSKYQPAEKYGTKLDRMEDFFDVLLRHPKLSMISAHLGCWPENLPYLGNKLDQFANFYLDTSSTRWMIRELGKNPEKSVKWLQKYADRLLFGCDISIIKDFAPIEYWATRYWSQKLFWETNSQAPLAFPDADNPFGTIINGINLSQATLEQMYYKTAFNLFNIKN